MLALSLARAQRTDSLQVPKDFRLDSHGCGVVALDLLHPPGQEVGGIRPLADEDAELRPADAEVARDTRGFRWTADIERRQRPAPAGGLLLVLPAGEEALRRDQ